MNFWSKRATAVANDFGILKGVKKLSKYQFNPMYVSCNSNYRQQLTHREMADLFLLWEEALELQIPDFSVKKIPEK